MRIEQLKYLVDIVQTGSLTATAERMFVTQQAISKSMKQLEQELGITILMRTNMGVQITPMGQKVVEFAELVLAEELKLSDAIQEEQVKPEEFTLFHICSTSAVTNIVIPDVIAHLNQRKQNIKFKISMLDSLDEIIANVQNKKCDLGLVTFNAEELLRRFSEAEQQDIYLDILARDEMIALMHKRFIKNADGVIPMEELFGKYPMTLYNIIPVAEHHQEVQNHYLLYSNDADFHRAMLEKNGAIVLMPALAQQYFFNSKRLANVDLALNTPLLHAAIYRKDANQTVQNIAAMIRREMQLK